MFCLKDCLSIFSLLEEILRNLRCDGRRVLFPELLDFVMVELDGVAGHSVFDEAPDFFRLAGQTHDFLINIINNNTVNDPDYNHRMAS